MRSLRFNNLYELTKRNILLFLKSKMTVFFSFLAPLLLFALYVIFLGGIQSDAVKSVIPADVQLDAKLIKQIADAWMIGGVISISCFTIGLNSMLVMIADKETKTINDFTASPVSPILFLVSYFLAAFILTFVLCLLVLILGLIYLLIAGGARFSFGEISSLVLVLFLSCLSSVMFMISVMSFFTSNASSAAFSGLFSAIIGFLTGAYIPTSMLPAGVEYVANVIPGAHSTALFRSILMSGGMEKLTETLSPAVLDSIKEVYSVGLKMFGSEVSTPVMYIYLSASIIVFALIYVLITLIRSKTKR